VLAAPLGFGFGFDGVGGVEVGLGIEEVTGVLALGRGIESEDITRGRGLLGSMVDDGQVGRCWRKMATGKLRPEEHDRLASRFRGSKLQQDPILRVSYLLWPRETH
jgi:hypothetical protein